MRRILPVIVAITILTLAGLLWWQRGERAVEAGTQASLLPLLAEEETAGFARATVPGAIQFPRDLGPHPAYQTEWWYYTGNLETAEGRRFGYQLTFFRRALTPEPAATAAASDWRTNQVYLAHFTISDVAAEEFYFAERFARGAAGLAGAQAEPYRVWVEAWSATAIDEGEGVRLRAETEEVALDLVLTQTLPPILHGEEGLSQKGREPGNASYYYSLVQQASAGTVTVAGESYEVTGRSWKDHEYSTSALEPGAVGWDWFSLQFENGAAFMFFQIRREDGSLQAQSSGTFIYPDGSTEAVPLAEWNLEVTDTWTSPDSGATYPAGWELQIPSLDLALQGEPLLADQELTVSTVYWEGAVAFSGTWEGQPVEATGYVEMTGYFETMDGRL